MTQRPISSANFDIASLLQASYLLEEVLRGLDSAEISHLNLLNEQLNEEMRLREELLLLGPEQVILQEQVVTGLEESEQAQEELNRSFENFDIDPFEEAMGRARDGLFGLFDEALAGNLTSIEDWGDALLDLAKTTVSDFLRTLGQVDGGPGDLLGSIANFAGSLLGAGGGYSGSFVAGGPDLPPFDMSKFPGGFPGSGGGIFDIIFGGGGTGGGTGGGLGGGFGGIGDIFSLGGNLLSQLPIFAPTTAIAGPAAATAGLTGTLTGSAALAATGPLGAAYSGAALGAGLGVGTLAPLAAALPVIGTIAAIALPLVLTAFADEEEPTGAAIFSGESLFDVRALDGVEEGEIREAGEGIEEVLQSVSDLIGIGPVSGGFGQTTRDDLGAFAAISNGDGGAIWNSDIIRSFGDDIEAATAGFIDLVYDEAILRNFRDRISGAEGDLFDQIIAGTLEVTETALESRGGGESGAVMKEVERVIQEAAPEERLAVIVEAFGADYISNIIGVDSNIITALSNIVIEEGDKLEDLLADIEFAARFDERLEQINAGFLDLSESIRTSVRQEIAAATESIVAFKEKTAELGLDSEAAAEATRAYAEQLLGISESSDPESLTAAQLAWRRLNAAAQEAGPLLDEVGLSLEDYNAALEEQRTLLKENFRRDLALDALGLDLSGLSGALATIEGLVDTAAELGEVDGEVLGNISAIAARELSGGLSGLNAEQLRTLRSESDDPLVLTAIDEALKLLNETGAETVDQIDGVAQSLEASGEAWRQLVESLGESLRSLRNDERLAPITPEERLERLRQEFLQTSRAARLGDQEAAGQLDSVAREFLDASRGFNASSQDYVADYELVLRELESAQSVAERHADIDSDQAELLREQIDNSLTGNLLLDRISGKLDSQIQVMLDQAQILQAQETDIDVEVKVNVEVENSVATSTATITSSTEAPLTKSDFIGPPRGGDGGAFAQGGLVSGPGTGSSDSISARLSDGEFVMRQSAVERIGVERLQALNRGADLVALSGGQSSQSDGRRDRQVALLQEQVRLLRALAEENFELRAQSSRDNRRLIGALERQPLARRSYGGLR